MNINGINVEIVKGDIATVEADAYVVPQYRDHGALTGVAARLISSDCYQAVDAYDIGARYVRYPFGYALSFETGGEKVERLIHVVSLDFPKDKAFELSQLATYSVLCEAERCGIQSLAIPAIATGDGAPLKFSASAAAMFSAMAVFPSKGVLRNVVIPIWKSEGAYRYFCRGAESYVPRMRFNLSQDYDNMVKSLMRTLS